MITVVDPLAWDDNDPSAGLLARCQLLPGLGWGVWRRLCSLAIGTTREAVNCFPLETEGLVLH